MTGKRKFSPKQIKLFFVSYRKEVYIALEKYLKEKNNVLILVYMKEFGTIGDLINAYKSNTM